MSQKRDVAKEIRMKSIKDNAAGAVKSKVVEKEKDKKRSSFEEALSNALDIFRVGKTLKKAAKH